MLTRDFTDMIVTRGTGKKLSQDITELTLNVTDNTTKINNRDLKNRLYKKSVFKQFPLRFPDYDSIVTQEAVTYIYPQSFTIDWENNEVFILYVPSGGVSVKRWIVVFDLNTKVYKYSFSAGTIGGEGIVVKTEGSNRYLYVKSQGTSLGRYNITLPPTNLSTISPASEYDVGLFFDFTYRNGRWLVEQQGAPLGNNVRRTNFLYFDDSFSRISAINISPTHGGFWVGDYVNYIPKRQGMGLGDGYIVQCTGGFYNKGDVPVPYSYHGMKILNSEGSLLEEGLLDPSKMITALEAKGFVCDRIEGEGVHIAPDGQLYSLVVHQGRTTPESTATGLIIFKEMTDDENTIDFSSCGKTYQGYDSTYLSNGVFPRSGDGKMYNPFTGAILDTYDKILDFMIGIDLKQFSFYSSSVSVTDIAGVTVPASTMVVIRNANNSLFFADYYNNPTCRKYAIFGTSGTRTQTQIFNATS